MSGLDSLRGHIQQDLRTLGIDRTTWVAPREGVYDVLIVGGGQSGLGAAFGLLREKISNVLVLDENPPGVEGPWITYARMITLRTPKELLSIDLGVPSLTFRAWWEAQHGAEGWEALGKIPREDWMEYLRWYREVLSISVQNGVQALRVGPQLNGAHDVLVKDADGERIVRARKVILATGIQGGGQWRTPSMISDALPRARYAHTSDPIDYTAQAGKRIAILGGGASAFDNANHALQSGVGEVHVFVRRDSLPQINPIRFMERSGVIPRFASLSDAEKYSVIAYFMDANQPPTNDTFQRAAAWPGFRLHLGSPWTGVREAANGVEVTTPQGVFVFDFLVLSTGLITDPALRPELADLAPMIACWRDRASHGGGSHPLLDAHPYLSPGFEFTPKSLADAEALHGVFSFNYSALVSLGLSASAISGLRYAIPRLASAVADQLFADDKAQWMRAYRDYDEQEFVGEWKAAP